MQTRQKLGIISKELEGHAPFTLFGAAMGILCMLLFKNAGSQVNQRLFQVFHPTHVVLSGIVTASLFKLYKGKKGGFAVGGYSRTTKGITQEYMRVTPDSIRMYFDEETAKGKKGGFAVGGYSRTSKGPTDHYFTLKPDSAKFLMILDDPVDSGIVP